MSAKKPYQILYTFAAFLLLSFLSNHISAKDEDHVKPGPEGFDFIKEKKKGWFWYEKTPEPVEEKKQPPKEPEPAKVPEEKPEIKPPEIMETPGPTPFSPEWFRENLDAYRDTAIQNPTQDNVRAYLYLQRVMMDKAERFANVYQEVALGDPRLDETNRYPTAGFAGKSLEADAKNNMRDLLSSLSTRAGLFFFFKSDCPLCGQQAWILDRFRKQYGIKVVSVSVDGSRPDSEKEFFDVVDDTGQSSLMGAYHYPAIVLAVPPNTYKVIGQGGGYSIPELEKRTLLVAKILGVVTPQEYERALPVKGGQMLADTTDVLIDENLLDDPQELVDLIKTLTPIN